MNRLLITGGCGFIGANFVRWSLANQPDWEIVNLDALTYAGNLANLADLADHPRYRFVKGDIGNPRDVAAAMADCDAVVHMAAESHVDRSIEGPSVFVQTNVVGTQVLLDEARRGGVGVFVMVSTDEVYGSLGATGRFTEQSPLQPSSPYSASKTAADLLALSYQTTYDLPVIVTRCSNNYGPYQFPEKLIPLFVTNAMTDQPLPLYGDGKNVRDWIHVEDHVRALWRVVEDGRPGQVYNIGGNNEQANIDITRVILRVLGKPESLIQFVTDRPGHDRRYAIDAAKLSAEIGWQPQVKFDDGIAATVAWYQQNRVWWEAIKSGEYRDYYERMYANR
ncbi:MAG: dTDP-glucose 4,6-dehydratase [Candidatus Lernaella stagnicola]|nr:dTDP-glucose 4,6-dehydratase [Candidatus Lernaella stagnicola]